MALLNTLMAFNPFSGSYVGYAVVLVVAVILIVMLLFIKKEVIYIDPDTDYEIAHRKYGWGTKITVASANKAGKKFIGWSYDENGERRLGKKKLRVWKTTELYAVWEKPVVGIAIEDANAAIEFVYIDDATGEEMVKEVCPLSVNVPMEVRGEAILGWGLTPSDGPLVTASEEDKSVLTVMLYPVREGWDEVVEEPVEEVIEEPAPVVEEEPVVEEPAEEPNATVEFVYMDDNNAEINKDVAPLTLTVPMEVNGEEILGWGLDSKSAPIIKTDEENGTVTIQLYPVRKGWDEVVEEPVVEEPVEEAVEEAVEEPVEEIVEEVIEEPAEEVVEEEPAEEVAEEVAEEEPFVEVIEEPIEEPEEVVEEEPAEEIVEAVEEPVEEPVEEIEEEAAPEVVEEVVEEAAEEVVEEVVEAVEEEPVEEPAPEVAEEVVEEAVEEVDEAPVDEPAVEPVVIEPIIVPTYVDGHGNALDIKYSRSFLANVIQSEDTVKDFYSELKNYILSYKGVKSRISWKFDSYNRGREQLFKLKLRGKTICMYCALDPNEFEKSKYHHEAIDAKIFADVPMLVKIKSKLGLKKAKELVDIVMAKYQIEVNAKAKKVDYVAEYPYEDTDALVQKELVKILQADANTVKKAAPIVEKEEEPALEPVVEETPVVEEVIEEPVVEEVVEEPVVEEVVEEITPATTVEEIQYVESVSADEVDSLVVDEVVDSLVEEDVEFVDKDDNKKSIVNVDTLSAEYEAGDVVDLASLKEKGLVHKKSKSVKVLARGTLDKALTVKACDFSAQALKMIVLTGGKAVKTKSKVK